MGTLIIEMLVERVSLFQDSLIWCWSTIDVVDDDDDDDGFYLRDIDASTCTPYARYVSQQ